MLRIPILANAWKPSHPIVPLGAMVLLETCRVLARWANDPRLAGLTLAVNVSAQQLRQPDFVERVLAICWVGQYQWKNSKRYGETGVKRRGSVANMLAPKVSGNFTDKSLLLPYAR